MSLRVDEIFSTIQGEGADTGLPTTFVRLFGCNLRCTFCDQPQQANRKHIMSVAKVVDTVRSLRVTNVCITGGEPLIQEEIFSVIYELQTLGYNVSIETNGSIELEDSQTRSYRFVMDIKCPSSGVSEHNNYKNLQVLQPKDEVKFVIANREDYDFAKKVLYNYPTKAKIILSPMFDPEFKQTIGSDLAEWLVKDRIHKAKIGIQLHKVINVK